MNDPRIVCNYMLDLADAKGIGLTNLALQKLLFFAHSISLTEHRLAMVSGYFEAWKYGPVHPAAYQAFKTAGAKPIGFRAQAFDAVSRERADLPQLSDSLARDICERVALQFGRLSPGRLVDITHAEGGPWHFVVSTAEDGANIGLRIPDSIIIERHRRQKVSVTPTPRVGEPDEDSPLI